MQDSVVCPYYGQDEDLCDIGCGYITSHDANMIIRHCSCHFDTCQKYRELADRQPRTRVLPSPSKTPVSPARQENPPSLGLFCNGLATISYAFDSLPFALLDLHLLAIVLMLGASGMIVAGLGALKTNPLRALAFTGFGLFWLSILALDILPRAGFGNLPGAIPTSGYLVMWGLFSLIICQGYEQLTRISRVVFALMTLFLLLLSAAHATGNTALFHSAGLVGIASGLPGLLLGCRSLLQEGVQLFYAQMARLSGTH